MRYLEIGQEGIAFHETVGDWEPPAEVLYCDCRGVGVETWNPQNSSQDDKGNLTQPEWRAIHGKKGCAIRRQIFVDVTTRPEAKLGMRYHEDLNIFVDAKAKPRARRR